MRGPRIRPRPDHVSELTRGVRLPLAPIKSDHLMVLAEAFCQAYKDIRQDHRNIADSGEEADVNDLMCSRLNHLICEDSLLRQLVLQVVRGAEQISFDGSHLDKRPDFTIYLSIPYRRSPLIVEAKIIHASSSKRVSLYCRDGIRRFVEGEYAWGNHEAFMIGYVRDGSSIERTLKPFLLKPQKRHSLNFLGQEPPIPTIPGFLDFERTRHDRTFVYCNQQPPNTPGPITIWHLWL